MLYAIFPIYLKMKDRVLKIFGELHQPVDVILIMNDVEPYIDLTFFYVTDLESGIFEGCAALLWPDGSVELMVSDLEETSASKAGAEISTFRTKEEKEMLLKERLKDLDTLGLNGSALTYRNFITLKKLLPDLRHEDVYPAIEKARLIKDEEEIERIREACRIASLVAEEIPDFVKEGMKEHEAAAEIVFRMQKMGASGASFDPVVAFGSNSAEPHYSAGTGILKRGDPALFDFGARYRRYVSDITRAFFAREVNMRWEKIYEVVMEARAAALEQIRAGAVASEVDAAARRVIDSTEFRGKFIHSLGHGLGLSVHDGGRMAPNAEMKLEENMILTVEPGVYLPGEGGVRIEDDVRVTRNGYELLTTASRDLTII